MRLRRRLLPAAILRAAVVRAAVLLAAPAGLVALAAPAAALAQGAPVAAARLQGSFQLTGRITAAVAVAGERRGQTVGRVWTFTPQCSAGPCSSVLLTRPRAGGTDTVLLTETSPGVYSGSSQFYAPLRCRRHINPHGELVPFTVTVQVTDATVSGDEVVADQISAAYTNRSRINLTRCVRPPAHDAATYAGPLIG